MKRLFFGTATMYTVQVGMTLALALLSTTHAAAHVGGPTWTTPIDIGTTPMPDPIVRVSTGCSFSCSLEKLSKTGRGGTVFVPPGVWLSPPVNLSSHLTIYLSAGAVVKADTSVFREGRWPLIAPLPNYGRGHPDYNSSVNQPFWGARWAPFINGYNLTNVTIGGENGTLDGSGAFWWARHIAGIEKFTRPPLFSCLRCTDVLLESTTFKDSPFWTIHPVLGRRLTARHLHILAPNIAPNTDGFDPDSMQDVVFTDSYVSNGDDAIAIKAGWDCAGYDEATPCNNIYIRNITQNLGGGGLSLGSEMSGGISNVVIEDCKLQHGSYGIQIKTGITRGGFVKNISINDVEIIGTTKEAIRIDAFYGMVNTWCPNPNKRVPSVVDNIQISNVAVRNANLSVHFHGTLDVPTTRVHMQNVSFACAGAAQERCGGPGVATGCCLSAECLGGVHYTADGITPPNVMKNCAQ
eukprot:COSAG02_NODE_10716_length_1874_cov_2.851831_1_plen_465_part_00